MKVGVVLVSLAALLLLAGGAIAAPAQWAVSDGGNGHWYESVYLDQPDWWTAKAVAEAREGYLATITSQEEQDWVVANVLEGESWLGGRQQAGDFQPNEGWYWITGEPWGYTNWDAGEPNDHMGFQEDVLEIYGPGFATWNDTLVDWPNYYCVVESPVPLPGTALLLGSGLLGLLVRRIRS